MRQRKYRIISGGYVYKYFCQVKRWYGWSTFTCAYDLDEAKDKCTKHANPVIWEGKLP